MWSKGAAAQPACVPAGTRPPGQSCGFCAGQSEAEEPRPQGRWSPVDSEWLGTSRAGSGGQLAGRSRRKPGLWLSPGNRSHAVTCRLGHTALQRGPARNPLPAQLEISQRWAADGRKQTQHLAPDPIGWSQHLKAQHRIPGDGYNRCIHMRLQPASRRGSTPDTCMGGVGGNRLSGKEGGEQRGRGRGTEERKRGNITETVLACITRNTSKFLRTVHLPIRRSDT